MSQTLTVTHLDTHGRPLCLSARCEALLDALYAAFPWVSVTCGRRDRKGQAAAMAENVAVNRRWIEQTYVASPIRAELQRWVDAHPNAQREPDIEAGLLDVLNQMTDVQLQPYFRHLTGDAFDMHAITSELKPAPQSDAGRLFAWFEKRDVDGHSAAERVLVAAGFLGSVKLLKREGGLVRWHVGVSE